MIKIMSRIRFLISLFLVLTIVLIAPACRDNEPSSRFESAQQQSTQPKATAVAEDSVKGEKLNRYFPNATNSYQIVYTQEKRGFAQAKLKENGEELALMSISDIANNPSASKKFKTSSDRINNYPVVNQGTKATAVLVNNRYQVKMVSRSNRFNETNRKQWLEKFDLDTLAQL